VTKVIEIEGIGPAYAEKLQKAGVQTVGQLLEQGCTSAGRKQLAETTGIGDKLIMKWVNHADLFRIQGVGGQYAELLEKAGVDTVVELSRRKPENLTKKMTEINARLKLVSKVPDQTNVVKWIEEAKKLPRKVGYKSSGSSRGLFAFKEDIVMEELVKLVSKKVGIS
jgi:predicted flap endonuclease-1-like 5' DNA nuclease